MRVQLLTRSRGRRLTGWTFALPLLVVVVLAATSLAAGSTGTVEVSPAPPRGAADSASLTVRVADGSTAYAGTRVTTLRRGRNGADGLTKTSILLGRLDRKGANDSGFGRGGTVTFNYRADLDISPVSIASGPRGTLTVLGVVDFTPVSKDLPPKLWPVILRFTSSGRLDKSFAGKGYRVFRRHSDPAYTQVGGLAVTSGGRTVFGTDQDKGTPAVMRLTRAGRVDRGFGRSGAATLGLGSDAAPTDLTVSRNGVLTAVAVSRSSSPGLTEASCLAAQIDSDGRAVNRFKAGGKRGIAGNRGESFDCQRVLVDPLGRVWIAGGLSLEASESDSDREQQWQPKVARLTRDGSPDPSWGLNGAATARPSGSFQLTSGIALDSAGGAVTCSWRNRIELTAFDSAGNPTPAESSKLTAAVSIKGSKVVGCASAGAGAIALPGTDMKNRRRAAIQILETSVD